MWFWPPEGVLEWVEAQGIEAHEVMGVLDGKARWVRPAYDDLGRRALTITGRTRAGRALLVALRHLDGRDWEILAAREIAGSDLAEFAQWEAAEHE